MKIQEIPSTWQRNMHKIGGVIRRSSRRTIHLQLDHPAGPLFLSLALCGGLSVTLLKFHDLDLRLDFYIMVKMMFPNLF